jgi:hypothetical protein
MLIIFKHKMVMKKIFLMMLCTFVIAQSCRKKDNDAVLLGSDAKFTLLDYHRLSTLQWNGWFDIANLETYAGVGIIGNTDGHYGITEITARANKDTKAFPEAIVNGVAIRVPNLQIEREIQGTTFPSTDPRSDAIFGKKTMLSAFGAKGEMYIPQKIKLEGFKSDNTSGFTSIPVVRNDGITLKWNADLQNARGVIMVINYTRPGVGNYTTVRVLDDTGSFRVTPDLLSDVPNNVKFVILLQRGNYEIINDEDIIMCRAQVQSYFTVIP